MSRLLKNLITFTKQLKSKITDWEYGVHWIDWEWETQPNREKEDPKPYFYMKFLIITDQGLEDKKTELKIQKILEELNKISNEVEDTREVKK